MKDQILNASDTHFLVDLAWIFQNLNSYMPTFSWTKIIGNAVNKILSRKNKDYRKNYKGGNYKKHFELYIY